MKLRLPAILSCVVLMLCSACHSHDRPLQEEKWAPEKITSPELRASVDYLTKKNRHAYATNSDTAIAYSRRLIALFHKEKMPYNEFKEFLDLCELYNFRKHDDINALNCYAEALKILMQNRGAEYDFPYFYMDMGNMLYNNGLFEYANDSYDKGISIAQSKKDSFAVAVGYNNLGLVCSSQSKYDSAIIYFRKALEMRKNCKPQIHAHSYMYLASMYQKKNRPDSMFHYIQLAQAAAQKQLVLNDGSTTITILRDMKVNEGLLLASYYKDSNNSSLALTNYLNVLKTTEDALDWNTSTLVSYELAQLYMQLKNRSKAVYYAEKTFGLSVKCSDYSNVLKATSLLSQLFTSGRDTHKLYFYLRQTSLYTDSLQIEEHSEQTHTENVILITSQINEALNDYQKKINKSGKVILFQKAGITVLSIALLCLVICLFRTIKQRKQQKEAYSEHLKAVLEQKSRFESAKQQSDMNLANKIDALEQRLITLMNSNKVFSRKNLTMAELAELLDTNTTYLSTLLNKQFKTNFNDYINSYRIVEARALFESPEASKLSIDQIAEKVGFSSRRTFYFAFKKFTGETPALYQNNLKKGSD